MKAILKIVLVFSVIGLLVTGVLLTVKETPCTCPCPCNSERMYTKCSAYYDVNPDDSTIGTFDGHSVTVSHVTEGYLFTHNTNCPCYK